MVAVLFARSDSNYKELAGVDVWDMGRDAKKWPGGSPVVAHPPCRAWGRLSKFAKPRHDEKDLAIWAVAKVRQWGGVMEHPEGSKLWPALGLPRGAERDIFGGWTLQIFQCWFGHRAEKATLLYIVGCTPDKVPRMTLMLGEPSHVIASKSKRRPEVTKAEREHTPRALAEWLVELAGRCRV